MTDSPKYMREPQTQWEVRAVELNKISDQRQRAIAYLTLALGEGADFLSLAKRDGCGDRFEGTPEETHEAWCNFFETVAAEDALRSVHGLANATFLALKFEEKLAALKAVIPEVEIQEYRHTVDVTVETKQANIIGQLNNLSASDLTRIEDYIDQLLKENYD